MKNLGWQCLTVLELIHVFNLQSISVLDPLCFLEAGQKLKIFLGQLKKPQSIFEIF